MKNSAFLSHQRAGSFNFLNGVVCLNSYEKHDSFFLNQAFYHGYQSVQFSKAKSLILHEYRHLMDLGTTLWGIDFSVKKLDFYAALGTPDEHRKFVDFSVPASEIETHTKYLRIEEDFDMSDTFILRHSLSYQPAYGVMIHIHYISGGRILASVPLSMIALLECSATCSEFLSRFQDAKTKEINADHFKQSALNDLQSLLNDKSLILYSVLLHLVTVHFEHFIGLEGVLRLASRLARISLDCSVMACSIFAEFFQGHVGRKDLSKALLDELRRGQSRYLIFFYTILRLYEHIKNLSQNEADKYIQQLRSNPDKAIRLFFHELTDCHVCKWIDSTVFFDDFYMKLLSEKNHLNELGFYQSMIGNRELLKTRDLHEVADELDMQRILLGDDSDLLFGNKEKFSQLENYIINMEKYDSMESVYLGYNKIRTHRPPEDFGFSMIAI